MHFSSEVLLAVSLFSFYYISSTHCEKAAAAASCSALCDCSDTWVRCNNVQSIANLDLSFANKNIETLEISAIPPTFEDDGRRLTLPKDFSRFAKLKRLSIDNSGVSSIPAQTAQQLSTLQELDLHGNRIFQLKQLNLDQMPQLQSLTLDGNHIKRIRAGDFSKSKELRELFMDNNQVEKLDAHSLGNLPNLRRVMLKGNTALDFVSRNAFNGSLNIEHLDFSGSKLRHIPRALANLKNLETLDMDSSQLMRFSSEEMKMLKAMPNLNSVDLSRTDIKCTQAIRTFMGEMDAMKMYGCSAV